MLKNLTDSKAIRSKMLRLVRKSTHFLSNLKQQSLIRQRATGNLTKELSKIAIGQFTSKITNQVLSKFL